MSATSQPPERDGLPSMPIARRISQGRSWSRGLRRAGAFLGTVLLFSLSVVAGAWIHLNTPAARRLVMTDVNALLAPTLQGQIRIDGLGGLGLFGLSGLNATVLDPAGHPAIIAHGVRVRIATLDALRSVFDKKTQLTVELSNVSIDSLDVRLDTDGQGQLDLVNAFYPRTPSPNATSDPNARKFRLSIPHISLKHAWAHGQIGRAPAIDADLDAMQGAFSYAPDVLGGDVYQGQLLARRIANGADVHGSLVAHVSIPLGPTNEPNVRIDWEGTAAGVEHSVHGSLASNRLVAVIDVPQTAPQHIRALWPDSTIEVPARAHIEARGPLSDIDLGLRADVGDATLQILGNLAVVGEKTAKLRIDARNVDIHQIAASAPTSRLGFSGRVSAHLLPDGPLAGTVALRLLGGTVATNVIPAATIQGSGSMNSARALDAEASMVVDESGAPTHLHVHASPSGRSTAVHFELSSKSIDLDRVPELKHALRGSFGVLATGDVDLGPMTLNARVEAKADGIVQGATRVSSAVIVGHAQGPLAAPRMDVTVQGRGIVAGGLRFTSAEIDALGSARAFHVSSSVVGPDAPNVDATMVVHLADGVVLDAPRVSLSRKGERALITAREISIGGGGVRVEDGRIEGVGAPMSATVTMTPESLRVLAVTKGIDLARVSRLANLERVLKSGALSFDADLRMRRTSAEGHVILDVLRADVGPLKSASGHVEASVDGRKVACKVHVDADAIGKLDIDAPEVELGGGSTLSAALWRQAWGTVDIDALVDLDRMTAVIPPEDLPVSQARGKVHLRGHIARDDARDVTPEFALSIITKQLEIAAKTPLFQDIDGVTVYPPPPWDLKGIDLSIEADVNGKSGAVAFSAKAQDTKGPLLQLDFGTKQFPFAEALQNTGQLSAMIPSIPVDVHLSIPERGLGEVPDILKQSVLTGKLQGDITASGTLLSPKVDMTATVHDAAYVGNSGRAEPLDIDIAAHYDGKHGSTSVKAHSAQTALLDLAAQFDAAIAQFFDASETGADWQPIWKASAKAHLSAFPMGSIAIVDDKRVSGQLSGDISFADLHADAHADVALDVDGLTVGSVAYKSAHLKAKADGQSLDGSLRIDQTDGFFETKAHASASWGAAIAPVLDKKERVTFSLAAKNFRIAALLPFLDGTLDELDGRLDANTRVEFDPTANRAQASGTVELTRGTVEAGAGGGEFHDVAASLRLAPDGTITLEKMTARGVTGQLEVTGNAKLDGVSLQSAKAVIVIPTRSAIPMAASGTEIGNVDGRIELSEITSQEGNAMDIKVQVPQLRVALPEGSSTDAEALGAMDKVRIGAHRGNPAAFVLLPLDPVAGVESRSSTRGKGTRMTVEMSLADVQVVKGTELKVDLTGKVSVKSAGAEPQVTGQIRLKRGGTLAVQGKKFTVEDGTVSLVGADPSNPEIVVKASWTAPDGTVVYATFAGPLKTGKVTLSSEPTLPQQEIVELLLFGTADGAQAQTPTGTQQNTAIGAAGGEAAQPLNHMLGQLGLGAVSASVDTTQAANPRPEVEVQIAKDISVQIAVVLGQPPPGVNPDHTLLTVDWRFLSKWSLASTVGDAGTTIFDLLWQRRY